MGRGALLQKMRVVLGPDARQRPPGSLRAGLAGTPRTFRGARAGESRAGSGRAGMRCLEVTGARPGGRSGWARGGGGFGAPEHPTLSHLDSFSSAHRPSPPSHATGAGPAGACGALLLPQPPPLLPLAVVSASPWPLGLSFKGTTSWGLGRGEAPSGTGPSAGPPALDASGGRRGGPHPWGAVDGTLACCPAHGRPCSTVREGD